MYLTYDEYLELGGEMDESQYALAEFQARKRIDLLTLNRVAAMAQVPEEVKMAMMVIMKADTKFSATAQADNPVVASFSTDGYSESYGSATDQTSAVNRQVDNTVTQMLFGVNDDNGVPLIYKGLLA